MRYAAVLLIALSGACKLDPFPKGFDPFVIPKPSSGSHIELTAVTVSPTAVRAGSPFVASASATVGNCDLVDIVVIYGGQLVIQPGAAFQSSFTAILDQTVVDFHAYCVTPSGGPIVTPDQYIDITVAPAP